MKKQKKVCRHPASKRNRVYMPPNDIVMAQWCSICGAFKSPGTDFEWRKPEVSK